MIHTRAQRLAAPLLLEPRTGLCVTGEEDTEAASPLQTTALDAPPTGK